MVLRADGSEVFEVSASGPLGQESKLGERAGLELLGRLPSGVLAQT
jgi:hypothetical protein